MKKYLILCLQIVVFLILSGILSLGILIPVETLGLDWLSGSGTFAFMISEFAMLIGALLAAFLILRFWEKKPFSDLGFSFLHRGKDLLWGFFIAFAIYAIGFAVSVAAGWVRIVDVGFYAKDLLLYLLLMVAVGMYEELSCRGFVLGRMLNAGIHPFFALFLSSLLFAAMHLGNDGITAVAFISLTLTGMLLGATYLYTRNLAFPIALHTFWNWIQGAVCGYSVSGTDSGQSVFSIALSDNTLMNGGEFGFEGSLVCIILEVIFLFILLRYVGPSLNYKRLRY
ncbi:MAG: CPBP family intramembrane metalloprotease [Bacteroidaceae bacterium]|nr:CPBP family intramembrane metalloprotease [Bacteroidaceae bacterium]